MAKKRGLAKGRGLTKLLSDVKEAQQEVINDEISEHNDSHVIQIPINNLQPGKYQPRSSIDEDKLKELAHSIKTHGIMQPIVIREITSNSTITHEIIAGERRWRAAKIAGLATVPAIVKIINDEVAIALALIENIQREDLSAIEQAIALQRFADEFGMSHTEIAKTVGKARATVSNLLRLLNLHVEVKQMLTHGDIEMGHARAILGLPTEQQISVAKKVVSGSLTVRQTEQLVQNLLNPVSNKQKEKLNQDIINLSQQLSEKLGALVEINQKKSGKGKMTISYHSADELDDILTLLKADRLK